MTPPVQAPDSLELARCPLAALRQEGAVVGSGSVAVVRQGRRVHAFEAQCPHGAASLIDAPVRRGVVSCPLHGARFRLSDGRALSGPVRRPLTVFRVDLAGPFAVVRTRVTPLPLAAGRGAWVRRAVGLARGLRASLPAGNGHGTG